MTYQDILLSIIKLALWNIPFDEKSLESLLEEDWRLLYQMSISQGLEAIFTDGVDKLTEKSPVCKQILIEEGIQSIILAEGRWLGQMQVATTLADTFAKYDVKMLLIKGIGLSLYYPTPKHRECGDIDIYLFGKYEDGNRIASKYLGAKVEKFSKKEDHIYLGDFAIDNHINFLWSGNDKNLELDSYLKGLLVSDNLSYIQETKIFLPPINFHLLFLLVHSYSHFMREGIPLRQMTDLACFLNQNESNINWEESIFIIKKYYLKTFFDVVIAFIVYYFGLRLRYKPQVEESLLEHFKVDILGCSHTIVYHRSRLVSKFYIAKNAWDNKWRYDVFYEGGFFRFVLNSLKKV